jgi:hypothetical protein
MTFTENVQVRAEVCHNVHTYLSSRRNAEFRKSFPRCCAKTLVFVGFSAILSSTTAMLDSNLQVSAADGNA